MTTSKNARRSLLAAILVSTTFFLSCDDTLGIFASVAAETDNSRNLTKELEESSPGFVVRLGTTYYAGIGRLWSKPDGGTQWALHPVTIGSAANPFAGSGVVADVGSGDTLFVSFVDSSNGAGLGVWSTNNGSSWNRETLTGPAEFPPPGENLVNILAANDTVFAVTTNERDDTDVAAEYSIYYRDNSTLGVFTLSNIANNLNKPDSVAWDSTDSTYVFTAGDIILAGGVGTLAATPEPLSGNSSYAGVHSYDTGVIISTRSGYLHFTTDSGSNWTTAGPFLDAGDDPYSFSAPTVINEDGIGVDEILVVGTTSFPLSTSLPSYDGYLEFDVSVSFTAGMEPVADHSLISSAVDFDSSLTTRAVSSMPLIDPLDGTFKLFSCTYSYGLWSNTYDGANWGLWKRE